MSFSEPLINQVKIFLLSVGMGVLLCGIYIAVQSIFALAGKTRGVQLAADLVFSTAFALLSFFFMIFYNNGRVRLHLIIGEALGFAAFYVSAGKFLLRLLLSFAAAINKLSGYALLPFRRVGEAFINMLVRIKYSVKELYSKNKGSEAVGKSREGLFRKKLLPKRKKVDKIGKIHLQNPDKSV